VSAVDEAGAYSETRRYAEQAAIAASRTTRLRDAVTRATGLTQSGLVLAAVALPAWLLAYVVGGRPLYLVAYGIVGVLIFSWAIGRRPLPLEGTRSLARARLREGEQIVMEVTLTARRKLSTFILEERLPSLLGQNARLPVASLDAGESASQTYSLMAWRRGVYELGPLCARWGDPFGLTEREVTLAEPFELLVHPTVEELQDRSLTRLWEDPPIRPPKSKPWPSGMEFYGMRAYAPGDDIRKIVWRAYGRTGQLMVRESEQGITDKTMIVLDQDRKHHSTGVISESFEMGVRVAASLGAHHLKDGDAVTLEGGRRRLVGPLRGGMSRMALLDQLARVELGDETLAMAITRVLADPIRDVHLVVVTPWLEPDAAALLKLLLDRGTQVLVAAVVWDELAAEGMAMAAAMGAGVVEVRAGTPLSVAFRHEVGAGRL
jgi:uncharacterized protein (DUF58 family)